MVIWKSKWNCDNVHTWVLAEKSAHTTSLHGLVPEINIGLHAWDSIQVHMYLYRSILIASTAIFARTIKCRL